MIKKCPKCTRDLLANTDNFYKQKGKKDGLTSWCKECMKTLNKEYGRDNKETKNKRDLVF